MKRERQVAQNLSGEIDRLLAGTPAKPQQESPSYAGELGVARRLHQLSAGLPPAPDRLRQRVAAIVEAPCPPRQRRTWRSAAWGAATAVLVLTVLWMVVPSGQQVWAQIMRVFLGQTRVELTPTMEPPTRAVRERLRDLLSAELSMGRAPALPKYLPEGYELLEIAAISYPDLPSWISQPFYLELAYGTEGAPPGLWLRQYRLLFRDYGGIESIQTPGGLVAAIEEVDVSGAAGALLTFGDGAPLYTVLWERDGLLHELETDKLSSTELLQVARSVR